MKKRRIIGIAVFLLTAGLLLPQIAADIHFFFSKEMDALTLNPLEGWTAILSGGNPLRLYLMLTAIVALLLLWVLFTGSYLNYRSGTWVVTPDIKTPSADGQGQFGTAQWLQPNQISRYYGVWKIPMKNNDFQELMKAGKKDKEEIKHARVQID